MQKNFFPELKNGYQTGKWIMDSQWKNTRNYFQMVGKKLENAQDAAIRFMWEREIIIVQEVVAVLLYGKITDFLRVREKHLMKQLSGSC